MKTNIHGELEWGQIHGGSADDIANAVIQTTDGELVLVGSTISFGAGRRDVWLVKTSSLGFRPPLRFLSDIINFLLLLPIMIFRYWKQTSAVVFIIITTFIVVRHWKKLDSV